MPSLLEAPVSDAAVKTTRLLALYVYVGTGVAVVLTTAGAAVVVDGTAVVGTGAAVTVTVGAGVAAGCGVVVVQPEIRHANSSRHAILMYTEYLLFQSFCMKDHSFLYLICVIYDKLFYFISC